MQRVHGSRGDQVFFVTAQGAAALMTCGSRDDTKMLHVHDLTRQRQTEKVKEKVKFNVSKDLEQLEQKKKACPSETRLQEIQGINY